MMASSKHGNPSVSDSASRSSVLQTPLIFVALSLSLILTIMMFGVCSGKVDGVGSLQEIPEELKMERADLDGAPRLISRASWMAQPSMELLDNPLPAGTVVVCHTATDACNLTADCIQVVRYIQQFHMESRGWNDIAYNYLVGSDNCVYVGRGWEKVGAHTKGHNDATIGVAFIGTFVDQLPPPKQLEALRKLLDLGVRLGKLTKDYKLVAQCQLRSTASPGATLVKEILSWPHFDKSLPTSGCTSP